MRVNAKFIEVVSNIKMLFNIRRQYYPKSKTIIRISGVEFFKEQDRTTFKLFYSTMSDEITVSRAEERWDTYNNEKSSIISPCNYIWERFYIWFDGICNPCDVDYKSILSPGKLTKDNTIKSIWNSSKLRSLRESHVNGGRTSITPCDRGGIDW